MSDLVPKSLASLAERAAPATPSGTHLSEQELAELRSASDDDETLDQAFRHLASCAACRARMSEPQAQVEALLQRAEHSATEASAQEASKPALRLLPRPAATARSGHQVTGSPTAAQSPRTGHQVTGSPTAAQSPRTGTQAVRWLVAAAVAAGVLLTLALRDTGGTSPQAALVQRSYVGVMGDTGEPGHGVDSTAADRNVELKLQGATARAAQLVLADEQGALVAPIMPLTPAGQDLRAVVAPRTFLAHRGAVHAFVIFGEPQAVTAAAAKIAAFVEHGRARDLEVLRGEIRRVAEQDGAQVASDKLVGQ